MTDKKIDLAEEPIKEHPPSWDEVMKEKKIEEIKVADKESSSVEEVLIIENEACLEVLSAKERFYEAMKKTLHYMKLTAQTLATLADFTLMLASLFILYLGCLILTHHLEASRVMYHKTFQNIGQAIVVIGCLNILVFCPFGIWGTWKTNRFLVKTHNYWLLINILVHLVLLMHVYFNFMYQDNDKRKEKFDIEFKKVYSSCTGYPNMYVIPKVTELPECCCSHQDAIEAKPESENDDDKSTKECWPFESSEPLTKIAWRYWLDCGNRQDYLKRMIRVIKDGYRYLWLFISIEMSALALALIQSLFDEEEEDEITKKMRRRKRPKGKIQKAYWKCKRMIARRVLLVTLSILFVLSLFIWKLAKKNFIIHNVPAGFTKINVSLINVTYSLLFPE